jgi:DNA polymerase-3 subunit epsilon
VAAHNARFDTNVMRQSLARYNISEPHYLVIDTLATSKKFEPELPNHKLDTVSEALDVELWHHHNALSDSEACAGILINQEKQFGDEAIKNLIYQI